MASSTGPEPLTMGLQEEIECALIKWPPSGNTHFLPEDFMKSNVTTEKIRALLDSKDHSKENLAYISEKISESCKKLFVVLVYCKLVDIIFELIREGITDEDLPFTRSSDIQDPFTRPSDTQANYVICRKSHKACQFTNHDHCAIQALGGLDISQRSQLQGAQWMVLAPIFKRDDPNKVPYFDLDQNTVMPFLQDGEGSPSLKRTGGFGEVWPVRIHRVHQNIYCTPDAKVCQHHIELCRHF